MDKELEIGINQWLSWDQDSTTKDQIQALVDNAEHGKLRSLLCKRMEFGTAGLRSKMGPGFSQMNTLTIIQEWDRNLQTLLFICL